MSYRLILVGGALLKFIDCNSIDDVCLAFLQENVLTPFNEFAVLDQELLNKEDKRYVTFKYCFRLNLDEIDEDEERRLRNCFNFWNFKDRICIEDIAVSIEEFTIQTSKKLKELGFKVREINLLGGSKMYFYAIKLIELYKVAKVLGIEDYVNYYNIDKNQYVFLIIVNVGAELIELFMIRPNEYEVLKNIMERTIEINKKVVFTVEELIEEINKEKERRLYEIIEKHFNKL